MEQEKPVRHDTKQLAIFEFGKSVSIKISRPYPHANLISIRINSLIASDGPIRLVQVMSANQILRLYTLLYPMQMSLTSCQRVCTLLF